MYVRFIIVWVIIMFCVPTVFVVSNVFTVPKPRSVHSIMQYNYWVQHIKVYFFCQPFVN